MKGQICRSDYAEAHETAGRKYEEGLNLVSEKYQEEEEEEILDEKSEIDKEKKRQERKKRRSDLGLTQ